MYGADCLTVAANLTEMPALSLPAGRDARGLPIGIQLTANYFEEDMLFKTARLLEQTLGVVHENTGPETPG